MGTMIIPVTTGIEGEGRKQEGLLHALLRPDDSVFFHIDNFFYAHIFLHRRERLVRCPVRQKGQQ